MAEVLIVEDVDLQAALLRGFLSPSHTIVGVARKPDEAVELARETAPDAIIMDLNLKDGNGIDATSTITSFDETIQIIISTATIDDEIRQRATEASADDYLIKPYSKHELLELIEQGD